MELIDLRPVEEQQKYFVDIYTNYPHMEVIGWKAHVVPLIIDKKRHKIITHIKVEKELRRTCGDQFVSHWFIFDLNHNITKTQKKEIKKRVKYYKLHYNNENERFLFNSKKCALPTIYKRMHDSYDIRHLESSILYADSVVKHVNDLPWTKKGIDMKIEALGT